MNAHEQGARWTVSREEMAADGAVRPSALLSRSAAALARALGPVPLAALTVEDLRIHHRAQEGARLVVTTSATAPTAAEHFDLTVIVTEHSSGGRRTLVAETRFALSLRAGGPSRSGAVARGRKPTVEAFLRDGTVPVVARFRLKRESLSNLLLDADLIERIYELTQISASGFAAEQMELARLELEATASAEPQESPVELTSRVITSRGTIMSVRAELKSPAQTLLRATAAFRVVRMQGGWPLAAEGAG